MATAHARLRDFLPNARELALLFAARGLACVAAWQAGFRALSDDDYARIVIAQRFAVEPRFDPSGTSWLPAPFWLYGAAFRGFGSEMSVARGTAVALSLLATVLVYAAARLLGATSFGAMLGAVLSCFLIEYSTLLGIAAVPEVPCAALLLFGAATLARREPTLRGFGGVALTSASLSRYEAWPVALVFAAYCVWDALRTRRAVLLGCALLGLTGPCLWLTLGRLQHGDALFFVARVTAYRHALGGEQLPFLRKLLEYPRLLIWEGLLLWPMLLILAFSARRAPSPERLDYRRALLALAALLAFLMLGSVRDGVPTHHSARVLLPLWFMATVAIGHLMGRFSVTPAARVRTAIVVAVLTTIPFTSGLGLRGADFAQREAELNAGRAARAQVAIRLGPGQTLAIDTPDYGFFAVQAGLGWPSETSVLDEHDPRHPTPSPFRDALSLDNALRERRAGLALLTVQHASLVGSRCAERWRSERFVLFCCTLQAPPS